MAAMETIITPRLLPGVRIAGGFISHDPKNGEWYIDGPGFEHTVEGFRPAPHSTIGDAIGAICSFLAACAESYRYAGENGENSHLFPPDVREWAYQNADEISIAEYELSGC